MTYIKSPLNYTGGKYRLLPQILPLFPKQIGTFVDLFGGGFNVGVNIKADSVIYNDINSYVYKWLKYIMSKDINSIISEIETLINTYNLDRENKEGYLKLREDYNSTPTNDKFFTLVAHSFSNQIRFNKKGEFNLPFGKRTFNDKMKDNLIQFHKELIHKNVILINQDFRGFDIDNLTDEDFVYIDPPYLITMATYNENDGWNERLESELYEFCNEIDSRQVKFALSNVTHHKGKQNDILIKWSKNYKIYNLDFNYANSNYHTNNRDKSSTQEVLITNY